MVDYTSFKNVTKLKYLAATVKKNLDSIHEEFKSNLN
jgi:hypothetical protein